MLSACLVSRQSSDLLGMLEEPQSRNGRDYPTNEDYWVDDGETPKLLIRKVSAYKKLSSLNPGRTFSYHIQFMCHQNRVGIDFHSRSAEFTNVGIEAVISNLRALPHTKSVVWDIANNKSVLYIELEITENLVGTTQISRDALPLDLTAGSHSIRARPVYKGSAHGNWTDAITITIERKFTYKGSHLIDARAIL